MRNYFKQIFNRNNWFKTYLLKLVLTDEEKRFFSLLAPKDSVRTQNEEGYLHQQGWWLAQRQRWHQNAAGEFIPWFSYPSIAFLLPKLNKTMRVLEYGGGSSTLFWATHTKHVTTIEHDDQWAKVLAEKAPKNCQIIWQKLEPFTEFASAIPATNYHIVLVDGRQRVKCLALAVRQIAPDGIIILDDSERPRYASGKKLLIEAGFRELPFWGLRHQAVRATCTSLFYRVNNCLRI